MQLAQSVGHDERFDSSLCDKLFKSLKNNMELLAREGKLVQLN